MALHGSACLALHRRCNDLPACHVPRVNAQVLRGVYDAVRANRHVDVSATLLKAAFVTPGLSSQQEASPEQVG